MVTANFCLQSVNELKIKSWNIQIKKFLKWILWRRFQKTQKNPFKGELK